VAGAHRRHTIGSVPSGRKARQVRRERERTTPTPLGSVPVDRAALAPHTSLGPPYFVELGFYRDQPFTCVDCGRPQVWRASQQKWWYEVAKGAVESTAIRCRPCRAKERAGRGLAKPRDPER
jgi:hypothetical protein